MSYVIGYVLYWLVGMGLEYGIVPFLVTPGKPWLHYIDAFAVMSLGAGLLGLVAARTFRLHHVNTAEASCTSGAYGFLALLVNAWLCYISTPRGYSYLDPSNIVLFGPLVFVSVTLFFWSAMLSISYLKQRQALE